MSLEIDNIFTEAANRHLPIHSIENTGSEHGIKAQFRFTVDGNDIYTPQDPRIVFGLLRVADMFDLSDRLLKFTLINNPPARGLRWEDKEKADASVSISLEKYLLFNGFCIRGLILPYTSTWRQGGVSESDNNPG